jgi:hypothetical protein
MERKKGMAALFYINEAADRDLDEALQTLLRIGCVDVSQSIGHYFSCTDSVIRLASRAGLPQARNHLFLLTMNIMQLYRFHIKEFKEPRGDLDLILNELVRKGGFLEYHYIILVNGLIKRRDYIGEDFFQHALAGIEELLPMMKETLVTDRLDLMTKDVKTIENPLLDLQKSILTADASRAYAALRIQLETEGMTSDLTHTILHVYTQIEGTPHDPHYVTFPVAVFELCDSLCVEGKELALAHTVEFALNRIRSRGLRARTNRKF